ncbi:MAG: hydrogen gas-evolving membrane-bound hydrogenase subunit E, partial [Pseudomonadota bacterium]
SRLLAICALGLVGIGVALIFLMFSAIDVAITQLMVETLFVVLVAIVLLRLPGFAGNAHPGRFGSLRDAAIAIGAGIVVALVTTGVALTPIDLAIPQFFEQNSYTEAFGRNIVNVILVDFRALDTLGEIAVVATAALAVIALLKIRPSKPAAGGSR